MTRRIDLTVPKGWHELDQEQLRFLLQTISDIQNANKDKAFSSQDDYSANTASQVATLCLMRWTGMKVSCPYSDGFLMTLEGDEFKLTAAQLAAAAEKLSWTNSIPAVPVRLEQVDGATAVPADLSSGFHFDDWLTCENYWQIYQATNDDQWLRKMAAVLYSKEDIRPDAAETLGVFYWWAAVKDMVTAMFPHLFIASGEDQAPPTYEEMRRAIDVQLRALTKGDITKERDILSMETMRALTELDAQAREYEEMKEKFPQL